MKKADLIEECKRLGVDFEGKNAELKDRIKNARAQKLQEEENIFKKQGSVEDLFKNYNLSQSKNESS